MNKALFICIVSFLCSIKASSMRTEYQSIHNKHITLESVVRSPKDTSIPAPVLFLLHGYGSNEKDLFSISNQIPNTWFVVSIRAPFEMAKSHYKWYDGEIIDHKVIIDLVTEEISRKALLGFIDQFIQDNNVDTEKVVTAGFSQGAGLGLTLALMKPEKITAAACFSGRVMDQVKPIIKKSKALTAKQVFIGHGTKDQRSPISYVEQHKEWLEDFGIHVSLHIYQMGHSIVAEELNDFVDWLNKL